MLNVNESLDSFIQQIEEDENILFDRKILEYLINLNEFSDSTIINHRIFVILRDYFVNLLKIWHNGEQFDENNSFIFETISNLFLKMSSYLSDENLIILKQLIFDPKLLDEINQFLENLSTNKTYLEDSRIKSLNNLFRTIQRISFDHSNDKLFDNLIKCICSSIFIEIFHQSVNEETEHVGQKFLLNTCTEYIYSHSMAKHQQSFILIRENLLHPFTEWINQYSSNFRSWNNRILIILRQISFLLTLSIELNRNLILEKPIFNDYCQLIDSFINIIYSLIDFDNNNKLNQSLIGTLIPNLYSMCLSNQLEKYFQSKQITCLILKLTYFNHDEIQLNAFKILSIITIEQDTKKTFYSKNLVKSFLKYLQEDQNQTLKFYNLLRCLKNLIQFEQIKEEFIRENGLSLILGCTNFQSHQIQQPVLDILLALTFHKQAFQQLKDNFDQIKSCLSSTCQEYIIWRLENEEQRPIIQKREYKYDFILSYSPCDRELCFRIYEELVKDDFRVWFDEITINEKCEIIDSCEYFLICLSESYKQSSYCRCEATYAYQRQYQIIPLIVTSNYRPDGWLNRLITGKVLIDFTKHDFQSSKLKLKNEINRHPHPIKFVDYPFELDKWTNEDIQLFLTRKNLHSLFPLFSQMNGYLLHELYRMCLANRESMFHTLKSELLTLNSSNQPLTLLIYLRFLNEIEKYIPSFVIDQK